MVGATVMGLLVFGFGEVGFLVVGATVVGLMVSGVREVGFLVVVGATLVGLMVIGFGEFGFLVVGALVRCAHAMCFSLFEQRTAMAAIKNFMVALKCVGDKEE